MSKLKDSMSRYGISGVDLGFFVLYMFLVFINIAIGQYELAILWIFISLITILQIGRASCRERV